MSERAPEAVLYEPDGAAYDEALDSDGRPRPHYARVMEALVEGDLGELSELTRARLREGGVTFGAAADGFFDLDPVPRLVTEAEWSEIGVGIAQRVRALDLFARDVYGEGRILEAGVVPRAVVETAPQYVPAMRGADVEGPWISVVGLDVVRCGDGRFRVIEDQVRMPSGIAYTVAAREVLGELAPAEPPPLCDPAEGVELLRRALRAAAPNVDEPSVVVVSEGRSSAAWYEHERLGRQLGAPVVGLADLERRGGRLEARVGGRPRPVDVVYQRTAEDCPEVLLEAVRRGEAACVNAPGCGLADDKVVNAYVEDLVRFYLGEEALLPAIRTYDLGDAEMRAEALDRLDELVVKRRGEMGGVGVVIWSHADRETRERTLREVEDSPGGFVAQELVTLSTHPTVVDGRLEPRHVDLRPYAFVAGEEVRLMPGALTRVALAEGSMIVNSGQGGGAKDSWIEA